MSKIEGLGYEQLLALRVLRDKPDTEASAVCKETGCSFEELFALADKGLIDIGEERLMPEALHPTVTNEGLATLKEAEERDII